MNSWKSKSHTVNRDSYSYDVVLVEEKYSAIFVINCIALIILKSFFNWNTSENLEIGYLGYLNFMFLRKMIWMFFENKTIDFKSIS